MRFVDEHMLQNVSRSLVKIADRVRAQTCNVLTFTHSNYMRQEALNGVGGRGALTVDSSCQISIYYEHQKLFNIYFREVTAAINQPCSKG